MKELSGRANTSAAVLPAPALRIQGDHWLPQFLNRFSPPYPDWRARKNIDTSECWLGVKSFESWTKKSGKIEGVIGRRKRSKEKKEVGYRKKRRNGV
jgi:hypothetical protein